MDYEEEDDDQMLGVSTVLPVAEGDDFEIDLPPVDGMDFLRRVRSVPGLTYLVNTV